MIARMPHLTTPHHLRTLRSALPSINEPAVFDKQRLMMGQHFVCRSQQTVVHKSSRLPGGERCTVNLKDRLDLAVPREAQVTLIELRDQLLKYGFDPVRAKRAIAYSNIFEEDLGTFIRQVSEILSREDGALSSPRVRPGGKDREPILSNHTVYGYKGSENFEHDDTGSIMNYSGVEDDVNNAIADHEGWEEGYDYS
jgi:hypothetical protein